ncbi:MAG: Uma2 family endonuclease, partial [Bacillota bacterium]
LSIIKEANIWGAPDLVVEILSPGTAKWDREIKREVYARFGVRELWLVDPQARSIEVATLKDGALLTLQVYCVGTTLVSPLLPGFALDVEGLFA